MALYGIPTIADLYPIDIKPFKDFAVGDYLFRNGCFYQKTSDHAIKSTRTKRVIDVLDPNMEFSTPLSFQVAKNHGGFTHE